MAVLFAFFLSVHNNAFVFNTPHRMPHRSSSIAQVNKPAIKRNVRPGQKVSQVRQSSVIAKLETQAGLPPLTSGSFPS
jgi:hypothetical protein